MRAIVEFFLGGLCLAAGMVLLPTPAPLGIPLLLIGLFLVARRSASLRRGIGGLRTRYPGLDRVIRRAGARLPRAVRLLVGQTRPRRILLRVARAPTGEDPPPPGRPAP